LSDGRGAADGPNERGKPDENGETGNQGDPAPAPAPGRPAANPLRFVTSDERLGLALLGFVTRAFRPTAEGIKGGLSMKPLTPDRATDRAVTVAYLTLAVAALVAKEVQPLFYGDHVVILLDGTKLTLSRTHRDRLDKLIERPT
jgi:hypothetical protein